MHLLDQILRALYAPHFLRLLGRNELEDDNEQLRIRAAILEDISEGVRTTLVRPWTSLIKAPHTRSRQVAGRRDVLLTEAAGRPSAL